jgi:transposase
LTTKIHMAVDGRGRPLRLILTPGQRGDVTQAPALLEGLKAKRVLADKAYDSNALRAIVADMGAEAVIPCNPTRKTLIPYDFEAYKARNLIERCFNKLKHFRRIATRYDRRALCFLSFVHLACAMLWMR